MTSTTIDTVDLRAASDAEYVSLNILKNAMRREYLPEDPPWPPDEEKRRFQGMPLLKQNTAWVAWDAAHKSILALAQADIFLTGDNPRVLWFNIEVLPEARPPGPGA